MGRYVRMYVVLNLQHRIKCGVTCVKMTNLQNNRASLLMYLKVYCCLFKICYVMMPHKFHKYLGSRRQNPLYGMITKMLFCAYVYALHN